MTQAMLDEGAQVLYVDELCDMRVASSLSEQTGAQIRVFYTCHNVTQEQMDAGCDVPRFDAGKFERDF